MAELTSILQLVLSFANLCILAYAFVKFVNKPHDTLEQRHNALEKRVDEHDVKLKEHEESLHHGNDNFRYQKDMNEVFINCMLAFIDFEIAYCMHTGYDSTEDLDKAKDVLMRYLAKK